MFRIFSIVTLSATFVFIYLSLKKENISLGSLYKSFLNEVKNSFAGLKPGSDGSLKNSIRNLLIYLCLCLILLLALTAYIPTLVAGEHMSGLLLTAHVKSALFFVVLFAAVMIVWSNSYRFNRSDFDILNSAGIKNIKKSSEFWVKISFWTAVLFGIPAICSIILMLYPIFAADGMVYLLDLHKYTSLFLFISVIFHTYFLIISRSN